MGRKVLTNLTEHRTFGVILSRRYNSHTCSVGPEHREHLKIFFLAPDRAITGRRVSTGFAELPNTSALRCCEGVTTLVLHLTSPHLASLPFPSLPFPSIPFPFLSSLEGRRALPHFRVE